MQRVLAKGRQYSVPVSAQAFVALINVALGSRIPGPSKAENVGPREDMLFALACKCISCGVCAGMGYRKRRTPGVWLVSIRDWGHERDIVSHGPKRPRESLFTMS